MPIIILLVIKISKISIRHNHFPKSIPVIKKNKIAEMFNNRNIFKIIKYFLSIFFFEKIVNPVENKKEIINIINNEYNVFLISWSDKKTLWYIWIKSKINSLYIFDIFNNKTKTRIVLKNVLLLFFNWLCLILFNSFGNKLVSL